MRKTPISFVSFNSSILRLDEIYGVLETKFNKHNTVIFNNEYQKRDYLLDDSLCGCYIIQSKKSLYYYIGYSDVIDKRLNTHFRYFKSLNHTFLQPQANPLQLGGSSNIYLLSSRNHIPASPNPKDRDEG